MKMIIASGRGGSVHFCRRVSFVNARFMPVLTGANVICFVWTVRTEHSVPSASISTKTIELFRRSSYHDVIRVSEIQKYLDITGVQTYIINSAKIVFLNERPQPRPGKGVTNTCRVCERGLLDSFSFCSLGCKVAGTSNKFEKKKKMWEWEESIDGGGTKRHNKQMKNKIQSFSPSTPPQSWSSGKRRKGIPHRAPTGGIIIEY
ncbi:Hypothetical predicted protein [Olea europaea subsp. europaea]|uniref:PLATZ transcription factor family protein n=1 Tax=Olea europaea subsp. europaea TaxID=158383 RepID=A0A8S0RPG4_OLEEU|nr:Hypothetical predicted protein [Olea europaea subsp. europaea]